MHVLVTGGSGFVGSNFMRFMLQKYPQYHITNVSTSDSDRTADVRDRQNYSFVKGDMCDKEFIRGCLSGVDVIFNFAAHSRADKSVSRPEEIERNIRGTSALIEAAQEHEVKKFVHISTSEIYGERLNGLFDESDKPSPMNPYAQSKAAVEDVVMRYHKDFSFPAVIVRPCNVYGPWQGTGNIIPCFITNLLSGKPVAVYGDGSHTREYIFTDDVSSAIDTVFRKGAVGEVYNIGTNDERTNAQLASQLIEMVGLSSEYITRVDGMNANSRRFVTDTTKLRKLGWEQQTSFQEGLGKTIEWYKNR